MQMRFQSLVACAALAAQSSPAFAEIEDCFPLCARPAPVAPPQSGEGLCQFAAVREAARIDHDLKPVKRIVGIVTNPTGFAIKQVNDHVVHIPPWVGYAMDPRGAIRAKVVDLARDRVKRAAGLQNDCVLPAAGEKEAIPAVEATGEGA
jgi:hypothetical protein